MSRFNKSLCGALFAAALAGAAPAQAAGPDAPDANIEATQDNPKGTAATGRGYSDKLAQTKIAKPASSEFRCWQGGQMIFEAKGLGPLASTQVSADMKPADGSGGRVQVLDMYEGLCILELPK
jgi:hypothetical protein